MANSLNKEIAPSSKSIRFYFPENAQTDVQNSVSVLNESLGTFEAISHWITQAYQVLIQNPAEGKRTLSNSSETLLGVIDSIHATMWSVLDGSQSEVSIKDAREKLNLQPPQAAPHQTLIIENNEIAQMQAKKIAGACHDIHGLVGNLIYISKQSRRSEKWLQDDLLSIQRNIQSLFQEVLDEYPKDRIEVSALLIEAEAFFLHYLQDKTIDVVRGSLWYQNNAAVIWSMDWYHTVLFNIIQNIQRSEAKHVKVFANISENTPNRVSLFFDNDGSDPDPDIVAHGFQYGVSHLGGKGIGMTHLAEILETKYDGKLTLEYRTDDSGKRVNGARIHIDIPRFMRKKKNASSIDK